MWTRFEKHKGFKLSQWFMTSKVVVICFHQCKIVSVNALSNRVILECKHENNSTRVCTFPSFIGNQSRLQMIASDVGLRIELSVETHSSFDEYSKFLCWYRRCVTRAPPDES